MKQTFSRYCSVYSIARLGVEKQGEEAMQNPESDWPEEADIGSIF